MRRRNPSRNSSSELALLPRLWNIIFTHPLWAGRPPPYSETEGPALNTPEELCRGNIRTENEITSVARSFEPYHPTEEDDKIKKPIPETAAERLGRGIIKTDRNKSKQFTILLVGETGTGKTSLLSLLGNIVVGRKPEQFVTFHDISIEAGGGEKQSQTNEAKVYKFRSRNGVRITILDTPGLADTRGLAQDELHKASIATAIKENISTVNAVIILANGTIPRLGAATDYALSTLSSIFPRTLADNIGILFTNVSSPLSWNFDQNSLPDVLRGRHDNQWFLDNPLAMWNKYLQLRADSNISGKVLNDLFSSVREGHQKSLEEISDIFEWLDGLKPQPTNEIMNLFETSQQINLDIDNAMSRATQISDKKNRVAELKQLADGHALTMKQYQNFKSVITSQIWVQENTSRHNTLCSQPGCYSNCHVECNLGFSLNPETFKGCAAMDGGTTCRQCRHSYNTHRHYNSLWKMKDHTQKDVDHDAEAKYNKAKREKNSHETMIVDLDKVIRDLDVELEEALISLGRLTESYARLSLSGSFAGQVKKSVRLMEANLEAMRNNKSDLKSVEMVEKSLDNMYQKLKVVEDANQKVRGRSMFAEEANEEARGNVGRSTKNILSKIRATSSRVFRM